MRTAALALMLFGGRAAAADPGGAPLVVALTREGGVFRLQAAFTVAAPPSVVWGVLTDYDGMTRFLSSLKTSRVVARSPEELLIEQVASARLMVFSRNVALKLAVKELPPGLIEFKDVGGGEFEEYDGAWKLEPADGGRTSVSYQLFAEMTPSLVPRAVARRVLEKSVRRQLQELAAEMLTRAKKQVSPASHFDSAGS